MNTHLLFYHLWTVEDIAQIPWVTFGAQTQFQIWILHKVSIDWIRSFTYLFVVCLLTFWLFLTQNKWYWLGPSRTSTSPADFPILLLDPLSSTPPQRQPRLLETKSHSPKPTQKSKYSRNSSDGSNPRRKTKAGVCACCGATSTPLWRDGKNGEIYDTRN